ncbi:right-handed parallel beta-helix repeat-containing protein [Novosphingobium indicum]|uniref:right-handed parallel beta-helix repeat-containing protein n=1 Tax=Novosphingobium indicum TaxID=462949 RepID=UPI00166F3BD7|nr:right-handed parallel beta-helix repeat-containing protein [Novosphingobium indicum]
MRKSSWLAMLVPLVLGLVILGKLGAASPDNEANVIEVGQDYPDLASAIAVVPAVRAQGNPDRPVIVQLPSGVSRLDAAVYINGAHGGTARSPLIIRGASDGSTQLFGSARMPSRPSTSADFDGAKVPKGALTVSLGSLTVPKRGLRRRGVFVKNRTAGVEVYQGGAQLWSARWPNRGMVTARLVQLKGTLGHSAVRFPQQRQKRWLRERNLWIGGRWSRGWDFELMPAFDVDGKNDVVRVASRASSLPLADRPNLFVANALSELDSPGEFFVDVPRRQVLVLPIRNSGGGVELAVTENLMILNNVQNVRVEGVGFNRSLGVAVKIRDSKNIELVHCAVRQSGGRAIAVIDGQNVVIRKSVVNGTAEAGIELHGGDRQTLSPARHKVIDSIVANFGLENPDYSPGIRVSGVGQEVRDSLISGGAHSGIIVVGNNNSIIENVIKNTALASNDVGVIYLGRDWTQRGNRIMGNYIHDFGGQGKRSLITGIYLDDQIGGTLVKRNIVDGGAFGVILGGGRSNTIDENLFVNQSRAALYFDSRGMNVQRERRPWEAKSVNNQLLEKLKRVPVSSKVWKKQYPDLSQLSLGELSRPKGNAFSANAIFGEKAILAVPAETDSMIMKRENMFASNRDISEGLGAWLDGLKASSLYRPIITGAFAEHPSIEVCKLLSIPDHPPTPVVNPNIVSSLESPCG